MTVHALAGRAQRAMAWSALTTAARFVLQLGAQVALARLLGPGPYGVYGLGIAVLTFATFLAGTGFSYSLLLREHMTPADIRLAFSWQLLAGGGCALVMVLAAPRLAGFFGEPNLAPMLQWLALACLLTAASGTAVCLLQRELDFRGLGLIQLAAYAAGYLGCGVPLAWAGWGAQALAMACVVQAGVTLALAWWRQPHPVRPLLRHAGTRNALGTGGTVFVTNLVNWLLANLDRLVIGRLLNIHAVGLYTQAWNFAQIPVTLLVGALQPALLASGAKLAQDRAQLALAWRLVLACVLVLVPPVAVTLALLAPDLVRLLWGPAWAEAGWILALMFLCLPAWAAWGLSTPVLWNTGRRRLEAVLQLPVLALAMPLWWLAAPQGLRWAAAVSAVAIHARAAATLRAGLRALDLPASLLLPLAARGGVLALACAGAASAAMAVLDTTLAPRATTWAWPVDAAAVHATASLGAGAGAALLAGLAVALLAPALLGDEVRRAVAGLRPWAGASRRVAEARP